jgi:hypothetical protein
MINFLRTGVIIVTFLISATGEASSLIKVRFIAEKLTMDRNQVRLADGEWSSGGFDLAANNLTPPQQVPVRTFQILTYEEGAELSTVQLPEEGSSFVVLLVMNSDGTYNSVVIKHDDPQFQSGDIYFYNNTDRTLIGSVGVSEIVLSPKGEAMLSPEGAKDNSYYDVTWAVEENGGRHVFDNSRWPKDEKVRSYVIFYLDSRNRKVSYRAVGEFVNWK